MKRNLLLILVALLPVVASAYDAEIDGIYYKFSGNEATVTLGSHEYSGAVVIPHSVTYMGTVYSVTSIGGHAFSYCSELTSVSISNNVTIIGQYAFSGCSGLTSVKIPDSVTLIGNYAFDGCSSLTSVTLNNNAIVSKSRNYSTSMKSIFGDQVKTYLIGSAVKSIGNYAFYDCSGLTSITIPNSLTGIGESAFEDCNSLTSITIPAKVKSIGDYAFSGCI